MDINQLRKAFIANATISAEMRDFLNTRINIISNRNEIANTLMSNPAYILHLIPYSAFQQGVNYDLTYYSERVRSEELTPLMRGSGCGYSINFEGVMVRSIGNSNLNYVQLYRNGIIESVETQFCFFHPDFDQWYIDSNYELHVVNALSHYFKVYERLNIQGPVYLGITFVDVLNHKFNIPSQIAFTKNLIADKIDRNILKTPQIEIINLAENPANILKSTFDIIWNACGIKGSINYDEYGKFKLK
jgi:hypothetical protein